MDGLEKTIVESLERVAETAGDPAPAVYERLFERYPDMQPLFVLDRNGSARGHMLSEALDCASNFIESEQMNHDGIGVPPDIFSTFLAIVVEVFKELLGTNWTAEMDTAWKDVLQGLQVSEPSAG